MQEKAFSFSAEESLGEISDHGKSMGGGGSSGGSSSGSSIELLVSDSFS